MKLNSASRTPCIDASYPQEVQVPLVKNPWYICCFFRVEFMFFICTTTMQPPGGVCSLLEFVNASQSAGCLVSTNSGTACVPCFDFDHFPGSSMPGHSWLQL